MIYIPKRNRRFYKGDKCHTCGKPITTRNKSGYCRACRGGFHTQEFRKRLSQERMGEGNPAWKGDNVKYGALHEWVNKRKEKPELCEFCNKNKAYDLANRGVYDRNLDNWWYLCRRCHMLMDGRMKNLRQYSKE